MPLLRVVIDDKLLKEIDEMIKEGIFEDRASAIKYALILLVRYVNELKKEGELP